MSETDNNNDDIEKRVLDAASDLFVHFGYDKTTMNDIASKARVAKSTIYLRWKKKEDVFEALLFREGRLVTNDWVKRVEADPKGGTFSSWMHHALISSFSNPFLKAIYKQDRRVLGSMIQRKGQEQLFVQRQALFVHFLTAMQAANAVRKDIDVHALTYLLNAMQFGLIQFADVVPPEHTPELSGIWEIIAEMLDRYVTPTDGGDAEAGKVIVREFMEQVKQMLDEFEKE